MELSNAKTRITHSLDPEKSQDNKAGFDFLGFTIVQKPETIRSVRDSTHGRKLGFRTLIFPSRKSRTRHLSNVWNEIRTQDNQSVLIANLNPVISGWSRYFGVSDVYVLNMFQKLDWFPGILLRKWARKRTGTIGKGFLKYWKFSGKRWEFGNDTIVLCKHLQFASSISQYVKVKEDASPYDGNTLYWYRKLKHLPTLSSTKKKLIARQKGICSFCKLSFRPNDILEAHHIIPLKMGGTDSFKNLTLVHGHCHDQLHAEMLQGNPED